MTVTKTGPESETEGSVAARDPPITAPGGRSQIPTHQVEIIVLESGKIGTGRAGETSGNGSETEHPDETPEETTRGHPAGTGTCSTTGEEALPATEVPARTETSSLLKPEDGAEAPALHPRRRSRRPTSQTLSPFWNASAG